jgi:ABC-2 type transport system permease protein
MSAILAIAGREWRAAFCSPLAWTLFAGACGIAAWWLLLAVDGFAQNAAAIAARPDAPGVTDLVVAPHLASVCVLLVAVVPLLTMRSICGERRDGTLPLLFSAGAGDAQIVLGKFLGSWTIALLLVLVLVALPLVLAAGTPLDFGRIAVGALVVGLLAGALCALGVLASAIAHHPATAALGAMGAGALLWIVDAAARSRGEVNGLVNWLAIPGHVTAALRGVLASVDVAYFVLLATFCLALATRFVARLREEG